MQSRSGKRTGSLNETYEILPDCIRVCLCIPKMRPAVTVGAFSNAINDDESRVHRIVAQSFVDHIRI